MHKFKKVLTLICFLVLPLWCATRANGDAPKQAISDVKIFSANHKYFVVSKVKSQRSNVFSTAHPQLVLWDIHSYFSNMYLSNDGSHVVAVYEGGNLIETDASQETPFIRFYSHQGLIRAVPIREIFPDMHGSQRTMSHWAWDGYLGFAGNNLFVVRLADGKVFYFDSDTGMLDKEKMATEKVH